MKAFVCFTLALLVAVTAFGHVPSGIVGGYDHITEAWDPSDATFSHSAIIGGTSSAYYNLPEYGGRVCQTLLTARKPYPECDNEPNIEDCRGEKAGAEIKAAIASRWPDSVFPYTDLNTSNPTASQLRSINNQYLREFQDCYDDIHYHWSISNTPASERNRFQLTWTWQHRYGWYVWVQGITTGVFSTDSFSIDLTISPNTGAYWEENRQSSIHLESMTGFFTGKRIRFTRHGTYTVTGEVTVDGQTLTAQETIIYPRPAGNWGNDARPPESSPQTSQQQFEPAEIIYLDATKPAPVPKGAEVAPTSDSTEPRLALGDGKESVPYTPTYIQQRSEESNNKMTFPQGVNSLHLPFKPRKSFFFTDLVNLLGDENVNSISVLRPTVQQWTIVRSSHSVHNEWISPQRGFVADMKNTVTVDLVREPDGGGGTI